MRLSAGLGANPIGFALLATGKSAIVILVASLAVSPLRRWTGRNWLVRFRRLLGLFAFFYALLHFSVYAGLDKFFDRRDIAEDVVRRPFITVGAFCLLQSSWHASVGLQGTESQPSQRGRRFGEAQGPRLIVVRWVWYDFAAGSVAR